MVSVTPAMGARTVAGRMQTGPMFNAAGINPSPSVKLPLAQTFDRQLHYNNVVSRPAGGAACGSSAGLSA
jgi:hypothetical protein